MAKAKFYYNEQTCKYEPIKVSNKQFFLNLFALLSLSITLAVGMIYIYHSYFTPIKESNLLKKNQELITEYQFLENKFEQSKDLLSDLQDRDDNIYRTILDIDPIPQTVRIAGVGGTNRYADLQDANLEQPALILGSYQKLDKLKGRLYIQTNSYDELEDVLLRKRMMWDSRPAITPLASHDIKRIGSGFRWRFHPILKINRFHWGLDITADRGKPIYASGDGVIKKKYYSGSYGNVVFIDHGFGYETRYAHLSNFNVEEGDRIKRGDVIGFIGSTGLSSANHLHYEVLLNGEHIDPVPYLSKNLSTEEFEKLIDDSNTSELILDY